MFQATYHKGNASQNCSDVPSCTRQDGCRRRKTNVGKNPGMSELWSKLWMSEYYCWEYKIFSHFGNQRTGFQQPKQRVPTCTRNFTSRYRLRTDRACLPRFIPASATLAVGGGDPGIRQQMDKQIAMDCYSL